MAACALLLGCWFACAPAPSRAQSGLGDIVFTVGTVARDTNGQNWAYILWQGVENNLISNRTFAVYSKPGLPTDPGSFQRLSIVTLQTDARVIEPLLRRAQNLGDDLDRLGQDLQQLFGSFMPAGGISRSEQLSAVLRGSLNDPRYYQNVLLLARSHAAVGLALGFADAELIGLGLTTFEIRAYDASSDRDLAVIGRVTVEADNPTVLPAPGPPVLVPEPTPMGDLNLKFRWGTSDMLRRLGLMQFGYNLYRVQRDFALNAGWNTTNTPPLDALSNLVAVAPSVAKLVNHSPILPSKLFTEAEAANLIPPTGDTNSFFIMDDDGRGKPGYMNYGFTNGAQFFYYVAARDVLGRDGILSTGLLATVCDRMPPYPPTTVHVVNDYQYDPVTQTSTQALKVVWKQSTQTNDSVINYWIYRWNNIAQMNALSSGISNNLIAIVAHVPGDTNNSYLDDGTGSPTSLNAYGETYWYTVRAGDAGACGQNLSGQGGPAFGVLRQRAGPPPGTGTIEINCLQPLVTFTGLNYTQLPTPDTVNYDLLLSCARLDPRFEWAEFYALATYTDPAGGPPTVVSNYFGPLYFLGGTQVTALWTPPRATQQSVTLQVLCRAALSNGKISPFATYQPDEAPASYLEEDLNFTATVQSIRTVLGPAGEKSDCREHDPGGGGGGVSGTNNICVHIYPSAGSKEYRIYRRVDDGPLTLLDQGATTNTPPITACDDAPPVNGGTMCFYLQLLDENGNPGPMTTLGCVDTAPVTPLPVPVLAKITPTGDKTTPGMTLPWFCPPYGVERFELRVAALPTIPNTNQSQFSGSLSSTGAPPALMTFTNFGTNLTLPFYSYDTPKVGPGFGANGSQFQVPCQIEIGKTYVVAVRSLGRNGNVSDFSDIKTFVWAPTNAVSPQVPWPARGLPTTNANFLAIGAFLSPSNTNSALRTASYTGNAVLVGGGFLIGRSLLIQQAGSPPTLINTSLDPLVWVGTNALGQSLFPCALYRYQVPTPAFPTVSGTAIQVSPLMENIAYQLQSNGGDLTNTIIQDPFITATSQMINDTTRFVWLWLMDTQPQIARAGYQYVIVHFGSNHEIDQLVPSNEVDVP